MRNSMQEKRRGIKVERIPVLGTPNRGYNLVIEEETSPQHPMFFTSNLIHDALTSTGYSTGKKVGVFLVDVKTGKDQKVMFKLAEPYFNLNGKRKLGLGSNAEEKILLHLIQDGLGHYKIAHNDELSDERIIQLAKRLNLEYDEKNPQHPRTLEQIRQALETHTVKTYHDLIKDYNERHKID